MINKIKYRFFWLSIIILTTFSCVSDDPIISDNTLTSQTTLSPAIVTVFNKFLKDINSENQSCFAFNYPITLGYNTNSIVTINDYQGLTQVLEIQSSSLNINSITFPFTVVLNENTIIIFNENDLISLINQCQINTIRTEFENFFNQCFIFEYPITLLDKDNNDFVINSLEEFQSFYNIQGQDYQPNFKFPITVLTDNGSTSRIINSFYDFYDLIDYCTNCPSLSYNYTITNPFTLSYHITPIIENNTQDVTFITWLVDGTELVTTTDGDLSFTIPWNVPGEYNICQRTVTSDCPDGVEFCKRIVVDPFCADLNFEYQQISNSSTYNFTANFEGINQTDYNWVLDGEIIGNNESYPEHSFNYQLTPGMHEVCIRSQTQICPDGIELCRQIEVPNNLCPSLGIGSEQISGTYNYIFTVNFDLFQDPPFYQWYVNSIPIESDGGPQGDNTFNYQFPSPGTYTVDIITTQDTNECSIGSAWGRIINIQ